MTTTLILSPLDVLCASQIAGAAPRSTRVTAAGAMSEHTETAWVPTGRTLREIRPGVWVPTGHATMQREALRASVGARLRDARVRRGLSQAAVTRLTGISQADLSALEHDKRYCWPGWRQRLAAAFEIPESELFAEEEVRP